MIVERVNKKDPRVVEVLGIEEVRKHLILFFTRHDVRFMEELLRDGIEVETPNSIYRLKE